jgi:Protein phosphatase 2C
MDGTGNSGASVRALPWQVHAASAIGAWHVRDGRPNEDAVGHQLSRPPDGPALLVVAVADGHGDSRHFRSGRGAKMAVAAGISAVRDWSANISGSPAGIKLSAHHGLVPGIVARWDAAVAADLAEDQFTESERALLADLALSPPAAYGSTLLVGAFTDKYAVFAQIGDGNVVAVRPDGRPVSPVPQDSRLDGIRTTSLCQSDARASFRVGVIQLDAQPLFAALLATDGFGNAQVEDAWQPGVAADLVRFGLDHDHSWFASRVPDWAEQCASSDGSGDDSTIALVINSAVRPSRGLPRGDPHPEPAAPTVPAGLPRLPGPSLPGAVPGDQRRHDRSPDHGDRRPERRGAPSRAWAWIAVAISVILAGLVLAFLLSRPGQPPVSPKPAQRPSHAATHQPSPGPSASARTSSSASVSPAQAGHGTSTPPGVHGTATPGP